MSDTTSTTSEWTGRRVIDTRGGKIGSVQDVHFDDSMERPRWLVIKTGVFGTRKIYVPAQGMSTDGDRIRVPYTESRVKNAPSVSSAENISLDEERELSRYYGLEREHEMVGTPSGER